MANEQQTPDHGVDGGAPTDEEARLAAQVDTIGDNPEKEPDAAPAGGDGKGEGEGEGEGDDPGAKAEPGTDPAAAPAPAPAPAADDPAAAPAPAPAAAPAAAADPAPAATLPPKPEPPKDFAAELKQLQEQYDNGDLEPADFQSKQLELIREEAKFEARIGVWEDRQRELVQSAEQDFANTALNWEQKNASFMENPLRAQAMQQAIAVVDQKTPGLPAAELFERAQKIAFEAYNWQAPAADPAAIDPAKAIADATAARQPGKVPQTLASAPAAAAIDQRNNAAYAELDGLDISSLEDKIARMSEAQVDALLRDAPGANTRGLPD